MPTPWRMSAVVALLLMSTGCSAGPDAVTGPDAQTEPGATAQEESASEPSHAAVGTSVTIVGAGDVAGDIDDAGATAALIRATNPDAVFTTGDHAYPDGSTSDYARKYDPTWGSFKDLTYPVPGNHDYDTADAAGYVHYFGPEKVTNSVDGGLYYAWDVGNGWRAYALNSEISTSGAQLTWLRDDVAAHPGRSYILYAHRPRHTSGKHAPSEDICPLWEALAHSGGLEIVLTGHNHHYERFAPMDCAGRAGADAARSFVIGSGGNSLYDFSRAHPGSEFQNNSDFGVLKLELYENSYDWEFISAGRGNSPSGQAGQILDKGSATV